MTRINLEKIMISNEGECLDSKGNKREIEYPLGAPKRIFRDTTQVSPSFEFFINKNIIDEKLSANAYCPSQTYYPAAYQEKLEYQLYKIKEITE